ncbi:hypothetical protein ACT17Q_04050 [Cellulomonas sp. CW35]|uniref:Alternate-type signal peptide domain-containing protein n=1 Tax=Cellulomonas uda TaxID=1714 RepID=A0A4Y3KDN7_CELUD|nr:hypothetical protein [Cellulomonas uda]NII64999.1 alternate signal-mediated exported protein [Cellulomonas uda]GEA82569.1 hypothetical protein CUD01_30130 [Cellulomonas uda]
MRTRRPVSLAAAALLVAGAAAGLTYALWGAGVTVAASVVRSGTLDLALVGTPTWTETSPDVSPAHAVATRPDGITADHLATPGDSFRVVQRFRPVLQGDNLAARLRVSWDSAPALLPAGGVTATYTVSRPDGVTSAAVPVGTPTLLPGAPDNLTAAEVAAWGTATWAVTVTLTYSGADVMVADTAIASAPTTGLGTVVVTWEQVRDGDGFSP